MHPHLFAAGGDHLRGHVAAARFATEQDVSNRGRIDAVGFCPQAPLPCKLVGLARMEQAHLVALGLQKAIEVLPASVNSCWIASQLAGAGRCHKPNRRF